MYNPKTQTTSDMKHIQTNLSKKKKTYKTKKMSITEQKKKLEIIIQMLFSPKDKKVINVYK